MDGREFDGARIAVQPGRGHRPNGPKSATRRTDHRITVEGIDSHTSWQDLKVLIPKFPYPDTCWPFNGVLSTRPLRKLAGYLRQVARG